MAAVYTLVRLLAMAHTGINVNYVRKGKLVWFVDQKASAIIELISRGVLGAHLWRSYHVTFAAA